MAKDKKLVESITSMDEDFAQWYTDIVKKAELKTALFTKRSKISLSFLPSLISILLIYQR